jgi:hypothetical protein
MTLVPRRIGRLIAAGIALGVAAAPASADLIVGAGPGGEPQVKVFSSPENALARSFFPFTPSFAGGVRVATGDIDGDGRADIVTGAGPGGGPQVKVFDGRTGSETRSFFAYDAAYSGGVFVASGDIDGDGRAELVTGGAGRVRAFSASAAAPLRDFQPFGSAYAGGVRVATGDVNGDGTADYVAGTDEGVNALVRIIDGVSGSLLREIAPYGTAFTGGVFVAAGDVDGDGRADVVTGAGAGGGSHVRVFSGSTGSFLRDFFAFDDAFRGGVSVAAGDVNGDGKADIVVGAGPGGGPVVKVYDGATGELLDTFLAFDAGFAGGVFVAAAPVPEPSTVLLMALGLAGLGVAARRRRRSATYS